MQLNTKAEYEKPIKVLKGDPGNTFIKNSGKSAFRKINVRRHAHVMKLMLLSVCVNNIVYIKCLRETTKKLVSRLLLWLKGWFLRHITQKLAVDYVTTIYSEGRH